MGRNFSNQKTESRNFIFIQNGNATQYPPANDQTPGNHCGMTREEVVAHLNAVIDTAERVAAGGA